LKSIKLSIDRSDKNLESGFYEQEEVAIESHYYGQRFTYANIVRYYAYLGEFDQAHSYFPLAVEDDGINAINYA